MLHAFFEDAARQWPERVAVDVPPGGNRPNRALVTYAGLDFAANRLAHQLRAFCQGECVVAVLLPRSSAHLYIAQLAILKAGAAYTCLDPSFPDERAREIVADSRAVALLTDGAGVSRMRRGGLASLPLIDITAADATPASNAAVAPKDGAGSAISPERLAYVIYTSGSTGRPKGVMVEHQSVCNLVGSDVEAFGLSTDDRVAQNSSASYDSSVEEIWLAFAAGATLVVMDEDAVRLGPDMVEWLRRERITVLCPSPTMLRAIGCRDPQSALPELKLLYLGGEPLAADLVDRWAPGRTMINGYGPTECTVTCLRDPVAGNGPVTIGRPIRGIKAWVLNDALEQVHAGEKGELYIGGAGLARGYWRQPELTAEKFITHPRFGRIYRTGDLVHRDAVGQFFYHGRIDAQVKLRGYRIELGEIESRLVESPGVRAAACCIVDDHGQATLAASVVPEDFACPPSPAALRARLAQLLPGYMVPGKIGLLSELPTSVSGKLDRAALVRLHAGARREKSGHGAPPRTALEAQIQAAMADVLRTSDEISLDDDFFTDLGGDSLAAAVFVTALRDDPRTAWVTVRDIYEARTVAALAKLAPPCTPEPEPGPTPAATDASPLDPPWQTTLLQTAWIAASVMFGSGLIYAAAFHALPWLLAHVGILPLVLFAPPVILAGIAAYAAAALGCAVASKKLLIGRYTSQHAPAGGGFYLRNWIVQRTVRLIPWWLIEATEFQNAALRALGAHIGKRVHLHRGVDLLRGGWDLLDLGDDVTVGRDAVLELVRYESRQIVVGPVSLGHGCTIETHAHVGAGARIGPNGCLAARASLARGAEIPAGMRWDGIPARPAGPTPEPPSLPAASRVMDPPVHAVWTVLSRLALAGALLIPLELLAIALAGLFDIDGDMVARWMADPAIDLEFLGVCAMSAVLPLPLLLATQAIACRAMGRLRPGVISTWSADYIRAGLKAGLVDAGSRWLYGTLLWPHWLRLAGMKIGQRCEISTLIDTIPELVEIGDHTFCADGIYIVGARIHRGTVTLAPVRIGRGTFIGNGAIIPGGTRLPDDILLGVCTVAHESFLRPGTSWFGHPPFELPRREIIPMERRLTHNPGAARYALRLGWELLRFALPLALALIFPVWWVLVAAAEDALPPAALLLAAIPLLGLGLVTSPAFLMLGIKWLVLGRVRPGVHALWSNWASRWDFVCLAWCIYVGHTAAMLDGTPWQIWMLRAAGMRVGRGVVLGNGFADDLPDPDMIRIEDGATVDGMFQAHTFEDRVLKMHYVTVRRNATVAHHAVVLYGAQIGAGTYVAPNSVVMKHERLLPGHSYEGAPTRPMAGEQRVAPNVQLETATAAAR
ncbi:MAG: amino acid adenylation domain-containing protein [Opitutaceae bacterium]|nr:amino acid adenylation domain-containing protein [Opitutaceae bacterium]